MDISAMDHSGNMEYETSVRLPITEEIFTMVYNKFCLNNCEKKIITYFNDPILPQYDYMYLNQVYRVVDKIFQHKYSLHRLNLLKILVINNGDLVKNPENDSKNKNKNKKNKISKQKNGKKQEKSTKIMFIPFTRTTAKEMIAECSNKFHTIRSIIVRFIIYKSEDMRICIEKMSEGNNGGSYYFSAELEYHKDYTEINYGQLTKMEKIFWDKLSTYLIEFYHLLDLSFLYNYVELTQLLHLPCRKFSSFHEYSCNMSDYKLKYKFDGYKGRMVCNNVQPNTIIYWDDMHNTGTIKTPFLNSFPHVVFQYELITNSEMIIFTDIIGVIFQRQLYMPEPNDVLAFFSLFPRQSENSPLLAKDYPHAQLTFNSININNSIVKSTFSIGVQFTIVNCDIGNLLSVTTSNTDGFIVVCNNREYKYKIPTLDVRIRNEYAYLDQLSEPIFDMKLLSTFLLNPNSVYEITLKRGQLTVLRERFERQFTSDVEEFVNFKRELAFMSQQLKLIHF